MKDEIKTVYNEEEANKLIEDGYKLFAVNHYIEYDYNNQTGGFDAREMCLVYTMVKG